MARHLQLIALLLGVLASGSPYAEGQPVVPPIDLPHSYYYREMYLPQLTSGPSAVAWAPDSREVVFSMAGSLWRQKIDSTSVGGRHIKSFVSTVSLKNGKVGGFERVDENLQDKVAVVHDKNGVRCFFQR